MEYSSRSPDELQASHQFVHFDDEKSGPGGGGFSGTPGLCPPPRQTRPRRIRRFRMKGIPTRDPPARIPPMAEHARLANVAYVSIAQTTQRKIGEFTLDPEILLPVELPPGVSSLNAGELSWEAIVAGTLKVLAWDQGNVHTDYYRRFVLAVKPDIKTEFTHVGILKARNGESEAGHRDLQGAGGPVPGRRGNADEPRARLRRARPAAGEARSRGPGGRVPGPGLRGVQGGPRRGPHPSRPSTTTSPTSTCTSGHSRRRGSTSQVFAKTGDRREACREAKRIIREIDDQGLMDGLFQKAFDAIRMGQEEEGIAQHHRVPRLPTGRSERLVPAGLGASAPGPLRGRQGCLPEGPGARLSARRPPERARDLPDGAR